MHPGVVDSWIRSPEDAIHLISEHTITPAADFTVGAELEWLVIRKSHPAHRVSVEEIARALGVYAPNGNGRSAPFPRGSTLTLEPGGQVELSSAPASSASAVIDALTTDSTVLRACLAHESLELVSAAADTVRAPQRILDAPRYQAMETAFDRNGPAGRVMMTNTAAAQVCVSAGTSMADAAQRWAMLNEAGPALLAAFASSPRVAGGLPGRWESQRMRSWFTLDPQRTTLPDGCGATDEYARWALTVPLLCVRRDGGCWDAPPGLTLADWIDMGGTSKDLGFLPTPYPTADDVLYHLSTLFPPVRPRGYFEVRYLDQQPGSQWRAAVAVVSTLAQSASTVSACREIVAGTTHLWHEAARLGMRHPDLRAAAGELLALAASRAASPTLSELISQYRGDKQRLAMATAPTARTPPRGEV
ncbi:glutamate-cysteine ligase family protein [Hoyosella altamirensis]|nr:glutamate-cysteine ligase family protein [Hoyosella altamirensis]